MKRLKLFCLIIALLGLIAGNSVWAREGHGGGGHKGGKHFGGGHKGGHHFGGGHRGGRHFGGGHRGGRHFGSGHRGGRHFSGGHKGRRHFGGFVGFGGYGYRGYGYPEYGGGYGDSYPPVIYIEQQGNTQAATNSQTNYSRYCSNPEGYYPHIKKCPSGWIKAFPPVSPPQ